MAAVANEDKTLYGVFTDGDLRRIIDKGISLDTPVKDVVRHGCVTVNPEMLAAESLNIMQIKKINGLIVVDSDNRILGAFNMHDLLKAGVY